VICNRPADGPHPQRIVERGTETSAEFSRKLGLPPSTLHRLEQCRQSITLRNLQQIMSRLKCKLTDIFPPNAA
jgi:DNA-binding Xre family transcriptional regulator